ncbi:hypothetical protein PT277_02290 [Acetobacteraceae bacterium ESL0709]|nr:hypothetical protein [Acetobacteraceae bacterium ESL0697]MDF7677532.1 hypothetical protein [Acetobacteraceae bacterium ESL0709]
MALLLFKLIVGLPLTSGPVSLFLAIEHGKVFTRNATFGSLIVTTAQAAFCLAYYHLSRRGLLISVLGACLAFVTTSLLLEESQLTPHMPFIIALTVISLYGHHFGHVFPIIHLAIKDHNKSCRADMVAGLFSFTCFFYCLNMPLTQFSLTFSYGSAILCTLLIQGITLLAIRKALYRQ